MSVTRLGTCPACGAKEVRLRNLKFASCYRDTLECDECDWQLSDMSPQFEAMRKRLFPTLNDRADRQLFEGTQKIGLMQNV